MLAFALAVLIPPFVQAQELIGAVKSERKEAVQAASGEMGIFPAAKVKWIDGPASLPAGAKLAVLEGDPTKEGFFTNAPVPAGWLQGCAALASEGGARYGHFGHIQPGHGKEVRSNGWA